jgi:WD40 repeat protein
MMRFLPRISDHKYAVIVILTVVNVSIATVLLGYTFIRHSNINISAAAIFGIIFQPAGAEKSILGKYNTRITSVDASSDGSIVAMAYYDSFVPQVLNWKTGKFINVSSDFELRVRDYKKSVIYDISFLNRLKPSQIVTADDEGIVFWNISKPQNNSVRSSKVRIKGLKQDYSDITLSQSGTLAASISFSPPTETNTRLQVWDISRKTIQCSFSNQNLSIDADTELSRDTSIIFLKGGKNLAFFDGVSTLRLLDPQQCKLLQTIQLHFELVDPTIVLKDPTDPLRKTIEFSPDGNHLVLNNNLSIELYDLRKNNSVRFLSKQSDSGESWKSIAVSQDGTMISAGGDQGTIKIWDLRTGSIKQTLKSHQNPIHAMTFSSDNRSLITADGDNLIRVWTLKK